MILDPKKLPPPPQRKEQQRRKLKLEVHHTDETETPAAQENQPDHSATGHQTPVVAQSAELQAWASQLEQKQQELKELEERLTEREAYIESCEDDLVMRTLKMSEREAELEQMAENISHSQLIEKEAC